MDPLSLAASIVGLLAAGVKITAFLHTLASNAQGAPQLAQSLIIEISGIEAAASSLQQYTSGRAQISTERGSLILVGHILTTLTGCVTTYSELQTIIDGMNIGPNMSIINRLKWAAHESKLAAVVQKLQNHKSSLTLMLSILQCRLMQEAEESRRQLSNLVEEVLRTNQDLDKRMRSFETEQDFAETSSPSHTRPQHMRAPDHKGKSVMVTEMPAVGFSFERDLRRSRPYNRTIKIQRSMTSLTSTARYTTAMSIFSKLSLSQVSVLSFYVLPIYAIDLSNSACYTFGTQDSTNLYDVVIHQYPSTVPARGAKTTSRATLSATSASACGCLSTLTPSSRSQTTSTFTGESFHIPEYSSLGAKDVVIHQHPPR